MRSDAHNRDYIESEFKKLGYELVTKTYTGNKQILEVNCPKGHNWAVAWNNFSRGTRCRKCFLESQVGNSKTLKKIVLRNDFYNISEAARILGVKGHDLRSYIGKGLLPGPKRFMKGSPKKYYKMEDIKKIEKMIE